MTVPRQPGRIRPPAMRSILFFQAIGQMMITPGFAMQEARIQLRKQGSPDEWATPLLASGSFAAMFDIAKRDVDMAVVNPSGALTMGYRGKGPFAEPVPVRVVTVMPSEDSAAFAVTEKTGIRSLADVKERQYPLRLTLRFQRDHGIQWYLDELLKVYGFTLDDIIRWGGTVSYDPWLPMEPQRLERVKNDEVDAMFEEATDNWIEKAISLGMRILPLDEPVLSALEDVGFRRSMLHKAQFPSLPADTPTLDFSGWPVYTHADVDEELIYCFCEGMDRARAVIPWEEPGQPLPLETMCKDSPATPMDVPLHPGAERYWREAGYLE
ncbi:MAG: hypothetical protein HW416_1860 [Chloroflexi bacterium]|nr:hypothetical protein [Chloroflexota bacterium]